MGSTKMCARFVSGQAFTFLAIFFT